MNCWQFKQCGSDATCSSAGATCPAYPGHGRNCASIPNTLCNGTSQDTLAAKLLACMRCEYRKSAYYDASHCGS